ncbi:NDR1/HIN1-like protein 1 [Amaranthus tricolor]|uniref:NDR1/HIN1-like protein 1 n=1 Tax=Amaranthus tricolor TaxID=29722 RepID=UPI002591180C|nr:NDR1/HIN1-like protein 1 [Amaranthus tricolor]
MYQGEEPPHHHHLPKMNDDDDDDDNDHHDQGRFDHQTPYPPPGSQAYQPPATPQQPLQPPKPLFSPGSRQPSKKRSTPTATPPPAPPIVLPPQQPLQPPQPIFVPNSPPPKAHPPPRPHGDDNRYYGDGDDRRRQLFAVITTLLLLIGLTALILWLLYRPSKPHFTAISAAVYSLNTTSTPPYVAALIQLTILSRNSNKRTSLYYDRLAVAVHYHNHPITPPISLSPLHHRKRSTIMMSPVIGGGPAVAVPPEVLQGLAADEAYGVVGLSWVLVGRVKYKAGWFRSGHNRVYVRCDVMVGFKSGGANPTGQVPLLGNPPCFVDM